MSDKHPWLTVHRGDAPLIVSIPHAGTEIPPDIESGLVSPWLARKDADWWVDKLYDFVPALDATIVRTAISRSVIDVNRDPSGKSVTWSSAWAGNNILPSLNGRSRESRPSRSVVSSPPRK